MRLRRKESLTTQLPNPTTELTGADGRYTFYARPGRYRVQAFLGTDLAQEFADVILPVGNDVLVANQFAGADLGAQINAARAAVPAEGGEIVCPPGTYSYSTPIVLTKNVKLACAGDSFTDKPAQP